jgi:hypothetical protein
MEENMTDTETQTTVTRTDEQRNKRILDEIIDEENSWY